MSAGMAGVIAAHSGYTLKMPHDYKAPFILACNGCGDERPIINEVGNVRTPPQRHNMHVTEELAKAGYGNVQEAPRVVHYAGNVRQIGHTGAPEGWTAEAWHESAYGDTGAGYSLPGRLYVIQCAWCEAVFMANTKAESMILYRKHEDEMQTPDPLAAALADPEGHALVKAIHDRKAEA